MPGITLGERVSELERQMSQVATRGDVRAVVEDVRAVAEDVRAVAEDVRTVTEDVRAVTEDVRTVTEDVRAVTEQLLQLGADMRVGFSAIREEIRTGDEESRRYMRTLYEDVIERLGMLRG